MIYKINLALTFLGSGKNDLQNQPRSYISTREKMIYKINLALTFLLGKK